MEWGPVLWNYTTTGLRETHVRIFNTRVYSKIIAKIQALKSTKPHSYPYAAAPNKYGKASHDTITDYETPLLDKEGRTNVQRVVASILLYERAVNLTALMVLSIIETEQTQDTNKTINNVEQFMDYMASNNNATMRYYALDVILNIHSDAKLQEKRIGTSPLCCITRNGKPIMINGTVYIL